MHEGASAPWTSCVANKDAASIYRSKEEDVLGKLHEKLQSERDKKTEKPTNSPSTARV